MNLKLRYLSVKLMSLCTLLCGIVLSGCVTKPTPFETTGVVLATATGYYEDGIVVELVDGRKVQFEGPTYVMSAETYRALMLSE